MHDDIAKRVITKYATSVLSLVAGVFKEDHIARDDKELQAGIYFEVAKLATEEGKRLADEVLGIKDGSKLANC